MLRSILVRQTEVWIEKSCIGIERDASLWKPIWPWEAELYFLLA